MPDQKEEARAAAPSLAGAHPRRAGERVPGTMRRIGLRHCVVTRPVVAELVDIGSLHRELALVDEQLGKARELTAKLEAQRAQTQAKIEQFNAAPIERVEGDPKPDVDEQAETERAPNVSPAEAEAGPSPTPAPGKRG